jgi:hypothetical protein
MKTTGVQVSDHALIRFMERVHKVDLEPVRREIVRRCWDAALAGARSTTIEDVTFCFGSEPDVNGDRWLTTILTKDSGEPRRRRSPRDFREVPA